LTTPVLALPLSEAIPSALKKKRVLLLDTSQKKRDLRAESMRKLGIDVDCAADISEARSWWRIDLYNLVLINMENGLGQRDKFCDDVRTAAPLQQLAFLVGKPGYLAGSPNVEEGSSEKSDEEVLLGEVRAALAADPGNLAQRWGILEACRQISAVRSASSARSKAKREVPAPVRDLETRFSKHTAAESRTLDELLRAELQIL
jgi:hypothetical protein